jgi:hypothetical protein
VQNLAKITLNMPKLFLKIDLRRVDRHNSGEILTAGQLRTCGTWGVKTGITEIIDVSMRHLIQTRQ